MGEVRHCPWVVQTSERLSRRITCKSPQGDGWSGFARLRSRTPKKARTLWTKVGRSDEVEDCFATEGFTAGDGCWLACVCACKRGTAARIVKNRLAFASCVLVKV